MQNDYEKELDAIYNSYTNPTDTPFKFSMIVSNNDKEK